VKDKNVHPQTELNILLQIKDIKITQTRITPIRIIKTPTQSITIKIETTALIINKKSGLFSKAAFPV